MAIRVGFPHHPARGPPIQLLVPDLPVDPGGDQPEAPRPRPQPAPRDGAAAGVLGGGGVRVWSGPDADPPGVRGRGGRDEGDVPDEGAEGDVREVRGERGEDGARGGGAREEVREGAHVRRPRQRQRRVEGPWLHPRWLDDRFEERGQILLQGISVFSIFVAFFLLQIFRLIFFC